MIIRTDLKSVKSNFLLPPQPSDLKIAATIPPLVKQLLMIIIDGNTEDISCWPESLTSKVYSFDQDLMYLVTDGSCITPNYVLLPFAVKSLIENVEFKSEF